MKAVVITKPGGPEVLEIRDVETPAISKSNQVLVRVRAAALNRADILQRKGYYPPPPGFPPDIPGLEFAGEVGQVGEDVRRWRPGQRVFAITGGGAQSEFVVTPEDQLAEVPSNLDWANAGAIPEVFITAHDALFTRADLKAGETVLVHAAGSGVGTAASQLAEAVGAKVFGTTRTADKLERAREYKLQSGVVVEQPTDFVEPVKKWSNGRGVDVVIDLVGAGYFEANVDALAPKGRIVLIGTPSGSKTTLEIGKVMGKRLTIIGTVLRARSDEEKAEATRLFEEEVVPLLASGKIKPVIDRVYRMEDVREAHARMEANESFGKIVLMID